MKRLYLLVIASLLIISGCGSGTNLSVNSNIEQPSGTIIIDRLPGIVVINNDAYFRTKEKVEIKNIGKQIGKVEVFLTPNSLNPDPSKISSNQYPKGTKLYSVKGEKEENLIAVKVDRTTYIIAYNINYKPYFSY